MRKSIFIGVAPLVLLAAATLSTPAAAINAREALKQCNENCDAVTHDGGGVSICKGGTFPGCEGGTAIHCSKGKECTMTFTNPNTKSKKNIVAPRGGILERDSGLPTQGPSRTGTPGTPSRGGTIY